MKEILESRSIIVSLAVQLVDDYTKQQPVGDIKVSLKDSKHEPLKNPSGYYLFFKLPAGTYTVEVKSDFYLEDFLNENSIELPLVGSKEPVKTIILKPNSAYPFPNGTTLIRGMVFEPNPNQPPNEIPAFKATVEIPEKNLKTQASNEGEYVFYFQPLKQGDIIVEQDPVTKKDVNYLKTVSGKQLKITATHDIYGCDPEVIEKVAEGKSNSVKYIHLK